MTDASASLPPAPPPGPLARSFNPIMLVAWIALMIGLCVTPIYRELRTGSNKNMDYDIWYLTAVRVLHGGDIYQPLSDGSFEFMYPPPAAIMLAPFSLLGEPAFVAAMVVLNSLGWLASLFLAVYLVRGRAFGEPSYIYLVPWLATVSYVVTIYNLGQPNILLMAALLGAFACLRVKRPWSAGALVAFAAAAKAFPIVVIVYLIYRRQWIATLSTILWLTFFMVLMPIPFRGAARHFQDLDTWTRGMVLSINEKGIAQRADYSHVWKNQSMIASVGRLLSPKAVDWADHQPADHPVFSWRIESLDWPRYRVLSTDPQTKTSWVAMETNFVSLPYNVVKGVIVAVALALGVSYLLVMPPQSRRTPQTDSIEQAMLLVLTIIASPLSWSYYGVWLMPAYVVIASMYADEPVRARRVRYAVFGLLIFGLMNLGLDVKWLLPIRGVGITFFGDLIMLALLSAFMFKQRKRDRDATSERSQTVAPAASNTPGLIG